MADKIEKDFSPKETQRRFEAALRGSRLAENKPMKAAPAKRSKSQGAGKKRAAKSKA